MTSSNVKCPTTSNIEKIGRLIGQRAENFFLTRQLWCSGAVLVVLNRALKGDLTQEQAIRLTAGMGEGFGGGGCICGGVNGAAMAIGLYLGNGRLSPGGDQTVMTATRWLHDQFKLAHGSTCCRVLLKKETDGSRDPYRACGIRTAKAAELGAVRILSDRPELIRRIQWDYVNQKDNMIGARIKIVADNLRK